MDNVNKETQCFDVLNCMKTNGFITDDIAVDLGVYRLSARIFDLRNKGFAITTMMCNGKNRHGHTCRYARYSLT